MNLKGYRAGLELTQEEMSEKIGIASVSYSLKENGERKFKQVEMKKIMDIIREKYPNATYEEVFFA